MKVSELKEGMFIIVNEMYNYGSLGKYISHTIEKDEEDGVIWCNVKFGMFIEIYEGRFCQTYKEYTMNFFCTVEDGEYVTDDIEEIKTTEEIVRTLYFNDGRFNKIHAFMNRNRNYVLVRVHEQHNKCVVKVICDRNKNVINDIFPYDQGCHFLSRLRRCTEEEKERLVEIIRTKCIDWG